MKIGQSLCTQVHAIDITLSLLNIVWTEDNVYSVNPQTNMTSVKAAQRSCSLLSKQQRRSAGALRPAAVAQILDYRSVLNRPFGCFSRRVEESLSPCRGRLVCTSATSTSEPVTQESKSRLPQEPAAPRRYALRHFILLQLSA